MINITNYQGTTNWIHNKIVIICNPSDGYYQQITNIGEGKEKRKPWSIVGGDINWYSHYRNSMEIPQKVKREAPYDTAIQLPSIYP